MIYKCLRKFKNVICLVVMICIMVPVLGACVETDNGLKASRENRFVGMGNNINAYTTYSQAKFIRMDKDLYYSYLMSMRDFILVVVPKDSAEDQPYSDNMMFQAAYNGVTPYAENILNGNFQFENPEYKILMYYVVADDLLAWEREAVNEQNESFVSKALDFMGPSSTTVERDLEKKLDRYALKNIVNSSGKLSECDFLVVDTNYNIMDYSNIKSNALDKCGRSSYNSSVPVGKNLIAEVAKASDKSKAGLTLLYGNGSLEGYIRYEDIEKYELDNVGWIQKLLQVGNYGTLSTYVTELVDTYICKGANVGSDFCSTANKSNYINQMTFKLKYDMSVLSRINKINYNTVLDVNASQSVQTGINTSYQNNIAGYNNLLNGDGNVNGGNYITLTTADGFIMDRGNIVLQGGIDAVAGTDLLSFLTQMDACTNKTVGAYFAEVLADVGIVAGGIAVGVGAVALTAGVVGTAAAAITSVATAGAVSLSVPGIGWIIGGALLLVAGAAALAVSVSTKNAINETSSANYCEVFEKAINEIVKMSYVRMPVYSYNIKEDSKYTTDICFANYDEQTRKCTDANGNDVGVAAFKYADLETVSELKSLTGAPLLRLYSNGKLVDEIYGAVSTQFIYSVMDSWGVTSASDMKFYAGLSRNNDGSIASYDLYDLLSQSDRVNMYISEAKYCLSVKYGEECLNGNNFNLNYNNFVNTKFSIPASSINVVPLYNNIKENLKVEMERDHKVDLSGYSDQLKEKITTFYSEISKQVELSGDGYYRFKHGDIYMKIVDTNEQFYVEGVLADYNLIDTGKGYYTFTAFGGVKYRLYKLDGGGYIVKEDIDNVSVEIDEILKNIEKEFMDKANYSVDTTAFKLDIIEKLKEQEQLNIDTLINDYMTELKKHKYYEVSTPVYFTYTIKEKDSDNNIKVTFTSVLYENLVLSLGGE